jgi:hypothetical protein
MTAVLVRAMGRGSMAVLIGRGEEGLTFAETVDAVQVLGTC